MLFQNSKFKIQKERLHLQLQLSRLGEGSLDVRAPSRQKAWAAVELGHKGAGQFPRRAPVIETLNASRVYQALHTIVMICGTLSIRLLLGDLKYSTKAAYGFI